VENNRFVIPRDVVFDESNRIMSRAVHVDNNMNFHNLEENIEPDFQDSGLIECERKMKWRMKWKMPIQRYLVLYLKVNQVTLILKLEKAVD